jgi:flagellar basal body-associated protein FliL
MLGTLLDRFRQKGPSRPRSKAETEKRRRVLIVLLIVLAVVSSVSVVGYGYYDTSIRPWHQRIIKVNGTVIEMRAFVKSLRAYLATDALYGGTTSPSAQLAEVVAESIMEESELMRQELESQIGDDAVEARYEEWLKGFVSDNVTDEELEQVRKNASEYFRQNGLSERDYRDLWIEPQLVREEFQKQIGDAQYPATDNFEHAQVQALLITGSDNATQLRARWEAGEAFDTLSTDNSVSSYQRDLAADNTTVNWVARGIKSAAFDNYTFSATPGVLSDPIPDSDNPDNYWLIKVVTTASSPLSESDRATLISAAFTKWLEEAKKPENNEIVYYLSKKGGQAKLAWALDHVAVSTS